MIVIYRDAWAANAASCNSVDAETALTRLRIRGYEAWIEPCGHVGCEVDTEAEQKAVDEICSVDW